jgi:carbamoylphosphate synthase large subunit
MSAGRVLVTGVGGPAGRSLSAQLLARDLEVVGLDMATVTIPAMKTAQVPGAADASFLHELIGIAERERIDLLIPTVTEELVVLAAHDLDSVKGMSVVVGPRTGVAVANDKWLTCRRLASAGVAVPLSALPAHVRSEAGIAERLGLPYLSKPRVGRGGRGVVVHSGEDGTEPHLFDASTILQEFIPGTEYAPNLYLARDPHDDVVVVLEKTALAHGNVGNAVGVRRVVADDVGRLARDAARALRLTGPVDLDVRRGVDGEPVVLEINARFGANSSHAPEVLDALLGEHLANLAAAA